jgi:hypothetical protein
MSDFNEDPPLLKKALEDENRQKYGLKITFHEPESKATFMKGWQKRTPQTDEDLRRAYNRKYTCYAYLTGYKDLYGVDFDWVWVYEVFKRRYPELLKTCQIKTPNGYRLLYFTKNPENDDTWKNTLHVELQGGKPAIVYGFAKDESGQLQEYQRIGTYQIKHEPKIQDTLRSFLTELQESCDYISYPCISSKLKHKKNHLIHDQRLQIANFFCHGINDGGLSFEDARDFFITCPDYDPDKTTYHLKDTLKKIRAGKLNLPRCESIQKSFQWQDCVGCPRRGFTETLPETTTSKKQDYTITNLDNCLEIIKEGNPLESITKIISKDVKNEDHLIKLILLAMTSAYTPTPLNMALEGPQSEGNHIH